MVLQRKRSQGRTGHMIKKRVRSYYKVFYWLDEKTIEQATEEWTLAVKTIELHDTQGQWN